MNEKLKKHHDYREHTWHISMNEVENKIALDRLAESGLSKAEFGRQALTNARVISRLNKKDKEALAELNRIGNNLNQLVVICKKHGTEQILPRVLDLDDMFTKIYNNLASKI